MIEVSAENKALATYLRSLWGGSPKVFKHADAREQSFVAIMTVADVPAQGVSSHATIGLSDLDQQLSVEGKPLRAELLFAAASAYEYGPNILATCAFSAMNDGAPVQPDAVLMDVVREYYPRYAMKHVLLHNPYLWDIETQRFDSKIVAWLLALPISDSEIDFAADHGVPTLLSRFEQHDIDIFDLDRKPVV